jgi:hypothetical protein
MLGVVVFMSICGFLGSVIDGQTFIWLGGSPPTMSDAMRTPVAALTLIHIGGIIGFLVAIQVYCRMIRPHLRHYLDSHKTT